MKLFYFSGSTLPSEHANTVHVMKMCAALTRECSHEVTLFAKSGDKKTSAKSLFDLYDAHPSFKIYSAPNIKAPILSGLVRCLFTIRHAVQRKTKCDIIYGRDIWSLSFFVGCKKPLILELHEIPKNTLQRIALKRILKAKNFEGCVVITHGLKTDLLLFAKHLNDNHILIAPDGADININKPSLAPLKSRSNTLNAGYAGSLYKGKGLERIIDIAHYTPHITFHIFGAPQKDMDKEWKETLPNNIVFYGHIPHGQIFNYLSSCDALLAPYQESIHINTGADISRWISPLKLFEYMATLKPIICSDLPVIREVLTNEYNALLVEPDNTKSWMQALERIISDENLISEISRNAYNDLEKKYSWGKRAQKITRFFEKALH